VVDIGTHHELLAVNGRYADLYHSLFAGRTARAAAGGARRQPGPQLPAPVDRLKEPEELPVLHILALLAATGVEPVVSTAWLQAHLTDPQVRVVYVGDADAYKQGHIPGARAIDHMDTVVMGSSGHRLAPTDALVKTFTRAGVADGARVVLYGDSPMATGWVNSALAAIGHGHDVSWLDGGMSLWQSENRPLETATPPPGAGPLTVRPAPELFVDAAWVRAHLESPSTKILDVRSSQEWNNGHVPNATLILWQDLYADVKAQKLKSPDDIRALLAKAGVAPGQEVVTYCAIGMRASLMAWAVQSIGLPVRIYLGSWQDWQANSSNPIAR
jgi:thiosulfate/3-mercaptopyruvate sulfurtransferase